MRKILPADATKKGLCIQMLPLQPPLSHRVHATGESQLPPNRPHQEASLMRILPSKIASADKVGYEDTICGSVEAGTKETLDYFQFRHDGPKDKEVAHPSTLLPPKVEDPDLRAIPRQRILQHQQSLREVVPTPTKTILTKISQGLTLPINPTSNQPLK